MFTWSDPPVSAEIPIQLWENARDFWFLNGSSKRHFARESRRAPLR
jgi:hypothetical protein